MNRNTFLVFLMVMILPEICFGFNGFFSKKESEELIGVDAEKSVSAKDYLPLEDQISVLFENLSAGATVAFVGVKDNNGEKTRFSNEISQVIEPKIVKKGVNVGITFIERNDLDLILDEWKLDMSGLVGNGDQGARALIGADMIIVGKTSHKRPYSHVSLKLTNLADGKILSVVDGWEKTDYEKPEDEIKGNVSSSPVGAADTRQINYASSPDGSLSLWTSEKSYTIGDNLVIFFEVTKPMYVKIFDATPDGEITAIFPNPYQPDNYCQPGIKYQIPPPGAPFSLEVTGPTGVDRLKAVASTTQVELGAQIKTRGVKFTKQLVESSSTRTNISFSIQ